jgi:hypothetical protein
MNERDAEFVNWKIYGPIKLPVDELSVTHAAFFFSKSAYTGPHAYNNYKGVLDP